MNEKPFPIEAGVYESVLFNLSNFTGSSVTFNIFNPQSLPIPYTVTTPKPSFFAVTSVGNTYNQFTSNLYSSPIAIKQILIYCTDFDSAVQTELKIVSTPLYIYQINANGEARTQPYYPNANIANNQNVIQSACNFDEKLILDGLTYFANYSIPDNTTVSMLIFYKQLRRVDYLTKGKISIFSNGGDEDVQINKNIMYTKESDLPPNGSQQLWLSEHYLNGKIY